MAVCVSHRWQSSRVAPDHLLRPQLAPGKARHQHHTAWSKLPATLPLLSLRKTLRVLQIYSSGAAGCTRKPAPKWTPSNTNGIVSGVAALPVGPIVPHTAVKAFSTPTAAIRVPSLRETLPDTHVLSEACKKDGLPPADSSCRLLSHNKGRAAEQQHGACSRHTGLAGHQGSSGSQKRHVCLLSADHTTAGLSTGLIASATQPTMQALDNDPHTPLDQFQRDAWLRLQSSLAR